MIRWTYGLLLAALAASLALAALCLAAIALPRASCWCAEHTRSCQAQAGPRECRENLVRAGGLALGRRGPAALPGARDPGGLRGLLVQRDREDGAHVLDEMEVDVGPQVLGDVLDVLLIALRGDHELDAAALRRQRLLLEAADR